MRRAVFKYDAPEPGVAKLIAMPLDAPIVHVGLQGSNIRLWAMVDPNAATTPRRFLTIGTGFAVESFENIVHHGTVQTDEGFVWHVIELPSARLRGAA